MLGYFTFLCLPMAILANIPIVKNIPKNRPEKNKNQEWN
jgi:hypothetical protein